MNKVLIIDASEPNVNARAKFLSRNGYDVTMLGSGAGLALKLRIAQPDLIVLDTLLPGESGYDVCRRLKQAEDTQYIPVLLVCDSDSPSAQTRAVEAGADDIIARETDAPVFLSKVKALFRIKHLSDQLKQQYAALAEKDKLLDTQLAMAQQVQRSMIRELDITHNAFHIRSQYVPAIQIGGDFYDVIPLDKNKVAIVIGDVSGHGISAALLTSMLHMMSRNAAPRHHNPAQFLAYMNSTFLDVFEDSGSGIYACMFYAVADTATRRIDYGNAGQPPPIRYCAQKERCEELSVTGTPIGMMRGAVYDCHSITYGKGDYFLFYTDGLADNLYKGNSEEFSSRLTALLAESCKESVALDDILRGINDVFYRGELSDKNRYALDDMSIIMCRA